MSTERPSHPTVVIVGAGFGGLRLARALRTAPVNVELLDRHNYHLFQPLLYQVATAGLSPDQIAHPVRAILRGQRNLHFQLADVTAVDLPNRTLTLANGQQQPYDYLVLAIGGATNFFGLDSVERHSLPLKSLDEAVAMRNHILKQFELAMRENDPARRRAYLTFAVVGGGPSGVETAGAISELIRLVLIKDYPPLDIKDIRILLLEATDRLVANMPAALREATATELWKKHIEVRYGSQVEDFDGERITLKGGEVIPARTLVWAAGISVTPLANTLGVPQGRQGRIIVEPTLQLPNHPEVFVIGDAAYLEDATGQPLPMVAPVAIQQADAAADNIRSLLNNQPLRPFAYKDPGSLATIGRNRAVARIAGFQFRGFFAWIVWLVIHLVWLVGFRNRLVVLINWAWDYFFYDRAIRLITTE